MNNFLSIGGGAAADDTPKTATMIDTMQATTGWTCYVGDDTPAWLENATRMGTGAHAGPLGTPWMYGFTGFLDYELNKTGCRLEKSFTTSDISTINNIGFWLAIDSTWQANSTPARFYQINLYLGSDGNESFTNSVVATYTPSNDTMPNNSVRFVQYDRTDFVADQGTFDWADFQDVRIEILGSAGTIGAAAGTQAAWAHFQGLQTNHYNKPTIIISHDDGPAGYYLNGKSITDSFGYKTTQFVYPKGIDDETAGVISLAQITELYNEGHDVCLHATYDGVVLSSLTLAEVDTDLAAGLTWMDNNGFTRAKHCVSWPQGVDVASDGSVYDTYADRGVVIARTTKNAYCPDEWSTSDADDGGKDIAGMQLPRQPISDDDAYTTLLRPALENLCKYGGVLILNFHNVVASGATGTAIDAADYSAALQIIKDYETRGRLQIKTISEVYDTDGTLKIA